MTNKGIVTLETERLILRQFEDSDLPALYEIMHKPEVMYAWERGFSLEETREWLNHQITPLSTRRLWVYGGSVKRY